MDALRLEDTWRIIGYVLLGLCVCAEVIAQYLHEDGPKNKSEMSAILLLAAYITTEVVAYHYEHQSRRAAESKTEEKTKAEDTFFKILAGSFASSTSDFAYRDKARAEVARKSSENPLVVPKLEPSFTGNLSVILMSANLVPFRYRFAVTTDGGRIVCQSEDHFQNVYPLEPLMLPCEFVGERFPNQYLQLDVVIAPLNKNAKEPAKRDRIVNKYRLGEDKITVLRIG